jgi:two-component system alkaline phosphatase synthesis response regulator PhoP
MEMTLNATGYNCKIASDGNLAMQYSEEGTYDLALLDIMMPEMDGYQLLEVFKQKISRSFLLRIRCILYTLPMPT